MLAGGAFIASGDLSAASVIGSAYIGALLGDQAGYRAGRYGGVRVEALLVRNPSRAAFVARARSALERWGGTGVFFSTWLLAPLGPWVNFVAGAMGMYALRFTLWDAAGEAIWVLVYVGLGWASTSNIEAMASILGNAVAALTLAARAIGLGLLLFRAGRKPKT